MNSGQKRSDARAEKRDAILQSAWVRVRHYGYNKTTVDDIARAAGIGKGTVYLHFDSKKEIMLALTDRTNERITRDLERIAAKESPPTERLRECVLHRIMTLFDLVHRYPHSEDVIASMLPEIVERIDRYVRRHGELLGQIIAEGCESGDLSVDDPEAAGQLVAGLFEQLTPPYYRFRGRRSLERFADSALDLMISGLAAHPAAG